jgi:hypothetical protein
LAGDGAAWSRITSRGNWTLAAGSALLAGRNSSTGIGLVEVYNLGTP